jgi:hypothetical protein
MNNLIHIISIIASLISIVVSILVYFGITRYIKLYMSKSVDKYAESYTDLPLASEKKVVVVLSVQNENELKNIFPTVNSLLDQTVRVNKIFLVLPCSTNCNVPENLTKVLSVVQPGKVYDDKYQDIITVLQREKEKDTFIIKVSNGIIYGKEFIENAIGTSESNPDSIIKDSSNSFLLIKSELFILDDQSKFSNFANDIKDMEYREHYKY